MSTSPSWFDQEKFSRLVKKVGPKPVPEAPAAQPVAPVAQPAAPEPEIRSAPPEGMASTARISLVSKPPSLLTEHRALPALPRRTTPLPTLKALFPSSTPPQYPPMPGQPPPDLADALPAEEVVQAKSPTQTLPPLEDNLDEIGGNFPPEPAAPVSQEGNDLAAIWQKMGELNEQLAHVMAERDHAVKEGALLREQLRMADEALQDRESPPAITGTGDLTRVTRERDEALAQMETFRDQLGKKQEGAKDLRSPTQSQELLLVTEERDRARKEYATVRKQFETLKQEQSPKEESGKFRKELEQQLEGFRLKLEERNREIAVLQANPTGGDEKMKQDLTSLREQLTRAKEETSIAQRGLALSQKALHETRDTLREATEGTSLSRHNFDNLKKECAALTQQNTVLQAQNEALVRELGAAKSKLTTRL